MKTKAVSLDTVKRESNTLINEINQIYYKKIGVLCLYENTG